MIRLSTISRHLMLIGTVVTVPVALRAQGTDVAAAHADAVLAAVRTEMGAPGIAAAVSVGGDVAWFGSAGVADLEGGSAVSRQTRFRIGSVSKLFAVAALARLVDQGRIDLDAPIARHLPDFPNAERITARQLAGHLSGLRNYAGKDFAPGVHIDSRHFPTTDSALSIFRDDSLNAEPGARYAYSVYGYTLLSAVIERAAGAPYLDVLQREVLDPLGLVHTTADRQGATIADRSRFYERSREGVLGEAAPQDPSYKWAAGGMLSTPIDLVRLGAAHVKSGFLTSAILREMFTRQHTSGGDEVIVGLGWRVGSDPAGRRLVHHAGSIAGGRAVLVVYPDLEVAVAITSNQSLAPIMVEATAQAIAEPFLRRADGTRSLVRTVLSGEYRYTLVAGDRESTGSLRFGPDGGAMTPPTGLDEQGARFGFPVAHPLVVLPALLTDGQGFVAVASPIGAFGFRVSIGEDDMVGQTVALFGAAVEGSFTAVRQPD